MFTHKRQLGATLAASAVAASMLAVVTPPASAAGPHKLELIGLYCNETEDSSAHDEAYLTVNDVRVWRGDMAENGPAAELRTTFDFEHRAVVRLYDEDTGIWDDDDFLGAVTVSSDQIGQGVLEATFKEDGANYRLTYRVVNG